jgi:Pyruvate/2-oxoglutarate dehydrogenase complex, dihydrolipoamide acyltransferase (E2) component, and related enzymes
MRHECSAGIARQIAGSVHEKERDQARAHVILHQSAVEALKAVPVVNGRIEEDDFIQNNFYDIGVAVGTERGLVVPIVRDADKKSFAELELDIAGYAVKRPRRQTKDRRSAGWDIHDLKRRRLWIASQHTDS